MSTLHKYANWSQKITYILRYTGTVQCFSTFLQRCAFVLFSASLIDEILLKRSTSIEKHRLINSKFFSLKHKVLERK